jgi:hypothetical protein
MFLQTEFTFPYCTMNIISYSTWVPAPESTRPITQTG